MSPMRDNQPNEQTKTEDRATQPMEAESRNINTNNLELWICSVGVMSGIDREALSTFQFGEIACINFTLYACTFISVKWWKSFGDVYVLVLVRVCLYVCARPPLDHYYSHWKFKVYSVSSPQEPFQNFTFFFQFDSVIIWVSCPN